MTIRYSRYVRIPQTPGIPRTMIERYITTPHPSGRLVIGQVQLIELIDPETGKVVFNTEDDTMPIGWRMPSNIDALVARYQVEQGVLPVKPNVVTMIVFDEGRLVMQVRSFVSPAGKPVSNAFMLSLHGGEMEGPDPWTELVREMFEELGIELAPGDADYGFDIYDAENGRTNHVYGLNRPYREMLGLLDVPAGDATAALLNVEGLGRAYLDTANLYAALQAGMVTSISEDILVAYMTHLVERESFA